MISVPPIGAVAARVGLLAAVLVRGSRIGELSRQELAEIIQDAWLSRASARRAARWLASQLPDE